MTIRRRRHREPFGLDTSSTADISFMLLIFFLLTTSMDTDKGMMRYLPTLDDSNDEQLTVTDDRLLRLELTADNRFLIDGVAAETETSGERIAAFIREGGADHVIQVTTADKTSFEAYYRAQECVVAAYQAVYDSCATARYGLPFAACTAEQRAAVADMFPQRVSERCDTSQEGGRP